eukprot:gene6675-4783_t
MPANLLFPRHNTRSHGGDAHGGRAPLLDYRITSLLFSSLSHPLPDAIDVDKRNGLDTLRLDLVAVSVFIPIAPLLFFPPSPTTGGTMSSESIVDYLSDPSRILVLDGGLGSQLEALGCDVNDPLWSGKTLLENPECIEQIHLAYLRAGARCILTASYQVTPESYVQHRGMTLEEGAEMIRRSVAVAKKAREQFFCSGGQGPVFVAGSIGPYGAYLADGSEYTGKYPPGTTPASLAAFHEARLRELVTAGVDIIAIETQAVQYEALTIVEMIEQMYPEQKVWVSFTVSADDSSRLPDGTPVEDFVAKLQPHHSIAAIGVNCVPLMQTSRLLAMIAPLTTKPLVAYPNSGEVYDGTKKTWSSSHTRNQPEAHTLAGQRDSWTTSGARLIGGCCRTGPADIEALAAIDTH